MNSSQGQPSMEMESDQNISKTKYFI